MLETQNMMLAQGLVGSYLPVLILVLMALGFALVNVVASQLLGPRREGEIKGSTYESGMEPVATARKRFNVRFYILAMIFLVFDVEVMFLVPWAVTYVHVEPGSALSLQFLGRVLFFLFTTIVAYVYCLKKGVFRFD
ncbi:MAG: NADH-quinone oxidoreductase subunit A [Planctomycetota bacterium]|jgi:NADH-quinone oxidoreductase subunit A